MAEFFSVDVGDGRKIKFPAGTPKEEMDAAVEDFLSQTAASPADDIGSAFAQETPSDAVPPQESPAQVPGFGVTGARRGRLPRGGQIGTGALPPSPEEGMTLKEVVTGAVMNAPSSAYKMGENVATAIWNPIDTATNIFELGQGLVQMIPGVDVGGDESKARAVGKFYMDRYGSKEAIKKAIAEDPIGVLADVSVILTGGGTLAARVPGTVGKVGKVLANAGNKINPVMMAAKTVKAAAKPVGLAGRNVIGGLGTNTGPESLRQAYAAGKKGGRTQDTFRGNMTGRIPTINVVDTARQALNRMRRARADKYTDDMAGVRSSSQTISMDPIRTAVDKVDDLGKYKGETIRQSTVGTFDKIRDVIDDWATKDPSDFHTPAGLDALKQKVYDVGSGMDWVKDKSSKAVVMEVYHAIRDEIAKAAPKYDKAMKGYNEASDLIDDITKTMSQSPTANIDTALRKLQSVMRNNANTNYGRRAELVSELGKHGGSQIMPAIAGQSLAPNLPRGLGGVTAMGNVSAGVAQMAAGIPPWNLAALPFQVPRLMGEGANALGSAARGYGKVGPTVERAALLANLLGRHGQDEGQR